MSIKHAILGLLSEGPLHGYELKSLYEELVPSGTLNFGQIYTTLARLHRGGLVEHDVVTQAERPDKKVYALTPEGRRELRAWFAQPAAVDLDVRNQTFLKLMLAKRLTQLDAVAVLKNEKRACFARLHEVIQARTDAQEGLEPVESILLLDLAVLRLEAFLKWLEHCQEALAEEEVRRG